MYKLRSYYVDHPVLKARETKHERLHPEGQSDRKETRSTATTLGHARCQLREWTRVWSRFLLADNALHSSLFKLKGLIEVYKYLRKSLGRNRLLPELLQSCQNSLPKTCCLCHRQEPLNQEAIATTAGSITSSLLSLPKPPEGISHGLLLFPWNLHPNPSISWVYLASKL